MRGEFIVLILTLILGYSCTIKSQVQLTIDGNQKKHVISPMIQGQGLIYCFEANSIYADGSMAQLYKDAGAGYLRYHYRIYLMEVITLFWLMNLEINIVAIL